MQQGGRHAQYGKASFRRGGKAEFPGTAESDWSPVGAGAERYL